MNREEAKRVAQQYLAQFRDMPYDGLRHLMGRCPLACDAVGPSGIRYQLELQIQWNDQPHGDLRVVALAGPAAPRVARDPALWYLFQGAVP